MAKHQHIAIEHLDETFSKLEPVRAILPPQKGWIRAIREALGMSGRQLGQRLSLTKARISTIERDEVRGAVTLATLQRVAEAMDCQFVYLLLPKTSLENRVRQQVEKVVTGQLERVSHSMALEQQKLSDREHQKTKQKIMEDMMAKLPRTLWDEQ